ncbi:MAG: DUF1080 domain-containing protein [Verrucomicrobia bacterium]|nr:DUF1080 domain-containing protein [Verrucomicrobiota bacterium]
MKQTFALTLGAVLLALPAFSLQVSAQNAADPFYGDWEGTVKYNGKTQQVAVCMIPLGNNNYEARFFKEFGKQDDPLFFITGQIKDSSAKFINHDAFSFDNVKYDTQDGIVLDATLWTGEVKNNTLKGKLGGKDKGIFDLKKTLRTSPTMGKAAPEGARILFDGTEASKENFLDNGTKNAIRWELKDNGALEVNGGDIIPKKGFNDCVMHIEFRSPYYPDRFGQARGNSGVYINGAYEIQVLDSYGLPGLDNDCAGIYQIQRPAVNVCFPPDYWQTYDIDFTMPRFDADGKKTANGRLTLLHNGVKVYDNLELPHATPGAINPGERDQVGLLLQDHGDKVQYRNIWVLEK